MKTTYLDYNATTPLAASAREAIQPLLGQLYGNPSSVHQAGQRVRHLIEHSREIVACQIGAEPAQIFFTSGGTEANHLALTGALHKNVFKQHIVVSQIEHPSVLGTAQHLPEGADVTFVAPAENGCVAVESVLAALRSDTQLVSLMHVNNETGAIQPIQELYRALRTRNVRLHVDMCQSLAKLPIRVDDCCDLASFSGHKVYGPKGVGALYVKKSVPLSAYIYGGHQEKNIRPGTENVIGIVGFGAALEWCSSEREAIAARLDALRHRLIAALQSEFSAQINSDPERCLANTLNFSIPGCDANSLMLNLDLAGVCVSTGSACAAGANHPSHVLAAMGYPEKRIKSALRISMGAFTKAADTDHLVAALKAVAEPARL